LSVHLLCLAQKLADVLEVKRLESCTSYLSVHSLHVHSVHRVCFIKISNPFTFFCVFYNYYVSLTKLRVLLLLLLLLLLLHSWVFPTLYICIRKVPFSSLAPDMSCVTVFPGFLRGFGHDRFFPNPSVTLQMSLTPYKSLRPLHCYYRLCGSRKREFVVIDSGISFMSNFVSNCPAMFEVKHPR